MRFRLPYLPPRLKWGFVILIVYLGVAWELWASLPRRPRLSITLSELGQPVAFSFDGKTLVTKSRPQDETSSNTLRVWDQRNGQMRAAFTGISGIIWDVEVAPDGSQVAAVIGSDLGKDKRIDQLYLWDVATGQEIVRLLLKEGFYKCHVRFAPDGRTLAFTNDLQEEHVVTLWDLPTRRVRTVLNHTDGPLAFSPDGQTLATISGISNARVMLWDVTTGKEKALLDHPRIEWCHEEMELAGIDPKLAFSADGAMLGMIGFITLSDTSKFVQKVKSFLEGNYEALDEPSHLVRVWDLATSKIRAERFLGYSYYADCPGTYWEGIYLLNLHQSDGCERLFDPSTGAQLIIVPVAGEPNYALSCFCVGPFYGIKSTAKGEVVLVDQFERSSSLTSWHQWLEKSIPFWKSEGRHSRSSLHMYDMSSKEHLATLVDEDFGCFSPDGRTLATYSEKGKIIHVWDVPPGRPWLAILGLAALPAGLLGLVAQCRLRPQGKKAKE